MVTGELRERPDLKATLAGRDGAFIRWAADQRLLFKANLDEEVEDFIARSKSVRLSEEYPAWWKSLSAEILLRDNYTCGYCGQYGGKLEIDHKTPKSRGGSDSKDNLITACRHCNRQKRNKTVAEYIAWRSIHIPANFTT